MRKVLILFFMFNCFMTFGQYKERYSKVIDYFSSNSKDSLRLKAALFLIDNMEGHYSPEGAGIDEYINILNSMNNVNGIKQLTKAWNSASRKGATKLVPDSSVIDNEYLISTIKTAFEAWETAPWYNEISFDHFCRYILPYRVKDEHLSRNWRTIFKQKYSPAIKGIKDMKKAFEIITDTIIKTINDSNPYSPYTLDVLTLEKLKKAECTQRCVLLVSILRSLGIPSAIDVVPLWANYSTKGHSWTALILNNGDTYTIFNDEKEAKIYNKIDASRFKANYKITEKDKCPFNVTYEKKVAKIYRICFDKININNGYIPKTLSSPFIMDVSNKYGLTCKVSFERTDTFPTYLGIYKTGADWTPISKGEIENDSIVFKNLGHDIVYVIIKTKNRKMFISKEPFLLEKKGIKKYFKIQKENKEAITLLRKYPLCSYMTDLWGSMKGGLFEASNNHDFNITDTIARINTMPCGETEIICANKKAYKYMRYKTNKHSRMPLAELHFYTQDSTGIEKEIKGQPIGFDIDSLKINNAFDYDLETVTSAHTVNYWIGIKSREKALINKIKYAPSSDTNNIESGHLYELYYFDTKWNLLERRLSKSNSLTFENVPKGALLLLKDKTKGKEERIFEYANNKQVWY